MGLMNEKIKELALQAGFEPYEDTSLSGTSELDETFQVGEYPCGEEINRFAELIIDECLRQVDLTIRSLDDGSEYDQALGAEWVGLAIARHFGVE